MVYVQPLFLLSLLVASIATTQLEDARQEGDREDRSLLLRQEPDCEPDVKAQGSCPVISPLQEDASGEFFIQKGPDRLLTTVHPPLQRRLTKIMQESRVPWGAIVVLDLENNDVLALAQHSQREEENTELPFRAFAPAASVFKIVSTASLLEHGMPENERVCFHGGKRRLMPQHLEDDPRRDHACVTLSEAFPRSMNVAVAKLTNLHLDPEQLRTTASALGFNRDFPFMRPVENSPAHLPIEDDFERAKSAVGFGEVNLSPLHAATLAATVANGGIFIEPRLIRQEDDTERTAWHALSKETATSIAGWMHDTVKWGTASRIFSQYGDLGQQAAGKTGSLTDYDAWLHTSWFVGYAPAENPRFAIATVLVNDATVWHLMAVEASARALSAAFELDAKPLAPNPIY